MECPSCGAVHSADVCPQSAASATSLFELSNSESLLMELSEENENAEPLVDEPADDDKPVSRLIEFPGVSRQTVPQWRKELSERVREVQERRAREAALEAAAAEARGEQAGISAPQLELLPPAAAPTVNPLVAAALRRLERAHQSPLTARSPAVRVAAAVAAVADTQLNTIETAGASESVIGIAHITVPSAESSARSVAALPMPPAEALVTLSEPEPPAERTRNLVAVPTPVVTEPPPADKPKPKRLISDDANDPALRYLDSVGTATTTVPALEERPPNFSRIAAGIIDLIVLAFLCSPFAAIIELQNGNWHQLRTVGLMGGIAAGVMFFYLTVTTALTGKTLGLRIMSLRAIDVRTGLIPTGNQSAERALLYVLSLATGGIGFLVAFAHGEGRAVHDRLSRTAVIRD